MHNTEKALDKLIERWQRHYEQTDKGFAEIEHDNQWPSPCELPGAKDGEQVCWQPVKNPEPSTMENVDHALELALHPDIKTYYTRYYSGELALTHEKGPVFLLQLWNEDDFARLQENIIGHVLMKRRLKQQITIFFALTDDENLMISMKNDSGEIWLESVGREPHLKLADSMAEFLDGLSVA